MKKQNIYDVMNNIYVLHIIYILSLLWCNPEKKVIWKAVGGRHIHKSLGRPQAEMERT